ncbi:MAG: hypothetical protein J5944_10065, partial [Lentisphaeria bacterium]|nr:hypothetical protein [Lentisphaeria bacterium]
AFAARVCDSGDVMINESPFLKKERYADRVFLPPPWGLNGFLPHLPGDESPGYNLSPRWGSPDTRGSVFREVSAPTGRQNTARGEIHAVDAAPGIWIKKQTEPQRGGRKPRSADHSYFKNGDCPIIASLGHKHGFSVRPDTSD